MIKRTFEGELESDRERFKEREIGSYKEKCERKESLYFLFDGKKENLKQTKE